MNARLAVAFLAVITSTGCIIVPGGGGGGGSGGGSGGSGGGGGTRRSGDLTFSWTFAGKACAEVPQVKSLVIKIPGETLSNGGVYPCLANNYPGVTLFNFVGGSYSYTISAIGFNNEQLFSGSGNLLIDGNTRVDTDLMPVGGATSYSFLNWTFPATSASSNPSCAQAGISDVLVAIDGAAAEKIPCAEGFGTNPGFQTPFLNPGSHSIVLTGVDSSGYAYYRFTGNLTTVAYKPGFTEYALQWAVGGVAVKWTLSDSSGPISCSAAGVTDVFINFLDSQGNLVYPSTATNPGDKKPCTSIGVEYPFLRPGNYTVQLTAFGSGNSVYQEKATPLVGVVANVGQFVSVSNATNVPMVRVQ